MNSRGQDAGFTVAVVLVNWNGARFLDACLDALAAQTLTPSQVIAVDNSSSDDSVERLGRRPWVTLVEAGENLGFAAGNNLGLAAVDSEWVALLNVDTVPAATWLAGLVEAAKAGGAELAGVASLQVFYDRPGMVNSTGIAVDAAGIAWDRLGGVGVDIAGAGAEVFGPSAGAALYRRAALLDVAEPGAAGEPEVFDPAYFMYLEDVDLAWRLRLRGWRSVYAPRALVHHVASGTSGEGSAFKNRLLARNKIWTILKNYPRGPLLRRWPLILAYDWASVPYRLLAAGQTSALTGRLAALGGLSRALAKRRRIQSRRTATWAETAAVMEGWTVPWRVPARYRHLAGREATHRD